MNRFGNRKSLDKETIPGDILDWMLHDKGIISIRRELGKTNNHYDITPEVTLQIFK
jgi:hypothetical protein